MRSAQINACCRSDHSSSGPATRTDKSLNPGWRAEFRDFPASRPAQIAKPAAQLAGLILSNYNGAAMKLRKYLSLLAFLTAICACQSVICQDFQEGGGGDFRGMGRRGRFQQGGD